MLYTLYRVYSFVKHYCSHSLILFSDLILHGSAVGLAKGQIFIIYKGNIQALTPHLSIVPDFFLPTTIYKYFSNRCDAIF